jgi:uncharacterized protein (TIGR02466 family)
MTEKVLRLFPTPVILHELDDAETLNAELEQVILARQSENSGLKLSNRGGWQSTHDFPAWSGEAGQEILRQATDLATAHTSRPGGPAPRWSVDAWANVSRSGHFNMPHVHGGSFWSAVYYVRVSEGEGGQLVLHDPRMPELRMHAPGVHFAKMGPEVKAEIKPKAGLLILFPAWLSHSVEPWEGSGDRISVAMNIRAGKLQA